MDITDHEFERITELIHSQFGIKLSAEKRSLVMGRLRKVLINKGFDDFSQYLDYLRTDGSSDALSELVDKISTNHTFFFRESGHFEFFAKEVLPTLTASLRAEGSKDLRIWCAGCATGEEPYTLVMLLREFFGLEYAEWRGSILATDISSRALEKAKIGVYPEDRLKELPAVLRNKYFSKAGPDDWKVKDDVRSDVTFRRFNLMNEAFPFRKPFHAIFCRNVMIYFDAQTRDALVRRFQACAADGAYFFIGHSETLGRNNQLFTYIQPAVYRRVASG